MHVLDNTKRHCFVKIGNLLFVVNEKCIFKIVTLGARYLFCSITINYTSALIASVGKNVCHPSCPMVKIEG